MLLKLGSIEVCSDRHTEVMIELLEQIDSKGKKGMLQQASGQRVMGRMVDGEE